MLAFKETYSYSYVYSYTVLHPPHQMQFGVQYLVQGHLQTRGIEPEVGRQWVLQDRQLGLAGYYANFRRHFCNTSSISTIVKSHSNDNVSSSLKNSGNILHIAKKRVGIRTWTIDFKICCGLHCFYLAGRLRILYLKPILITENNFFHEFCSILVSKKLAACFPFGLQLIRWNLPRNLMPSVSLISLDVQRYMRDFVRIC